jgi:hypothetical protein
MKDIDVRRVYERMFEYIPTGNRKNIMWCDAGETV